MVPLSQKTSPGSTNHVSIKCWYWNQKGLLLTIEVANIYYINGCRNVYLEQGGETNRISYDIHTQEFPISPAVSTQNQNQ